MISYFRKNKNLVFIVPIIILVSFYSVIINQGVEFYSAICITAGFAIGFTIKYGKKIILPLSISLYIGCISGLFFVGETSILVYIIHPTSHVVGLLGSSLLYRDFLVKSNIFDDTKFRSLVLHGFGAVVTIVLATIITVIISTPVHGFFDLQMFLKTLFGYFMGFLVFGVVLFAAFHYEDEDMYKLEVNKYSYLFVLLYIGFILIILSNYSFVADIRIFGYAFITFFFISGLFFTLRQILLLSFLYITAYQYDLTLLSSTSGDLSRSILNVNIYLVFMVFIGAIVRGILYEQQLKTYRLEISEKRLNETLASTEKILQLGERQSFGDDIELESYMREIFQVITRIFKKYDAASCYIRDGEVVKYIDAINYNYEELTNYKLSVYEFDWDKNTPIHTKNASKRISKALGKKYSNFKIVYPELKEHLSFRVFLSDTEVGGISLDIYKTSEINFTKSDFAFIQSFQSIINKYYDFNKLRNVNSAMKDEVVMSLIHTLELYDDYTGGHSEEVAYMSREIGKIMNLDSEMYNELFWAGIIHDIGKVGVPSSIINKKAKLTEEEYDEVKKHPVHGYNIIKKSSELSNVAILVKHHHEWFNGSGYPDGLKDNNIPLGSRVIAVCDAVSSMIKKRVYSTAKTIPEIREEIVLYTESQFCPIVSKAMLEFIDSGKLAEFYKSRKEH